MTEAEWLSDAADAVWEMGSAVEELSSRKLRLFCVACARRVSIRAGDARGEKAVEVAERYADGQASANELDSAHQTALALPVRLDAANWSAVCAVALETTMAI